MKEGKSEPFKSPGALPRPRDPLIVGHSSA